MASRGVNKVILVGRVGKDPEIRYMQNGNAVANLSIATSETWKDKNTGEQQEKTEWHRCAAFRKTAELIGEYVQKGAQLYVEGKLQTRKWQDQNGNDRYTTEIVIDQMQFLGPRPGNQQQNQQQNRPQDQPQDQHPPQQGGGSFEDDIPFRGIHGVEAW